MKTIIVYRSKYGCTAKCAELLKGMLPGEVTTRDLKVSSQADLSNYDCVVIGGSFYVGKIQGEVTSFCQANKEVLLQKKLALFGCGGNLDAMEEQFKNAFPEELRKHSLAVEHFGHKYDFRKMGFLDKMIVRNIAKVKASEDKVMPQNIRALAERLG